MQKKIDSLWFNAEEILIGGNWRKAKAQIALENPSTGETLAHIADCGSEEIDEAVSAANSAKQNEWARSTGTERGRLLAKMSNLVKERVEDLAVLEALDVGKPISQARADAMALARYLEFYAGAADKITGDTIPYLDGYTVYTLREPHGVTGHIAPWNYPMQIIGRSTQRRWLWAIHVF